MTVSASLLAAYSPEPGSSSATRHTPNRLSQNTDQHGCSHTTRMSRAAASGAGAPGAVPGCVRARPAGPCPAGGGWGVVMAGPPGWRGVRGGIGAALGVAGALV